MAGYASSGRTDDAAAGPEKLADIHREALRLYRIDEDADATNRAKAVEDMEFRWSDDQWDPRDRRERGDRPTVTINRMGAFVRQVTGDVRQNTPAIKVRAVESSDAELANVYTGLIRNIENMSDADTAYVTAADHSVTCGIGHFRVNVEYSSDDTFDQDIRIERIPNPLSVVWDSSATKLDRSDARHCFVVERMAKDVFKHRWPNATAADFDSGPRSAGFSDQYADWFGDTVRVAEYWIRKPVKRRLVEMPDGKGAFPPDDIDELIPDAAISWRLWLETKPRTRFVETHEVCQYIICGSEVLEGPHKWAGKHIPIVPVIGEEGCVGERMVRAGLVRYAKDAQRALNYMRSASIEAVAMQPNAPYLGTYDQIKGLEDYWLEAKRKNLPFWPYNPDPQAPGPPQRQNPPMSATGLMQEAALASDDMKAVMGIFDPSLGARSNETSGRAIIAREKQSDTGTYHYIDNLSKAIAHAGRIIIDLIPHVYDTERVIRTLGEDGSESAYIINRVQQMMVDGGVQPVRVALPLDGKDRSPIFMRDDAKYDIVVSVGPSYATKRLEAADSMMQFVQAVPAAGAVAADLIAKSMDWPDADTIAKRLRKMLPPDIDEEGPAQAPASPPPDPRALAGAEKDMASAAKTKEEAEGVALDNERKRLELSMMIPAIQQAVTQGVAQALLQALGPAPAPPPMQSFQPAPPAEMAGFSFPQPSGLQPPAPAGGEDEMMQELFPQPF